MLDFSGGYAITNTSAISIVFTSSIDVSVTGGAAIGADSLDGGGGNDVIYGNQSTDTVAGGAGNDTI